MDKKNHFRSLDFKALKQLIADEAKDLGFDECGFSVAVNLISDAEKMESWLEKSFHGEMSYLERNKEKRYDPRQLVENTHTIISVLQNYYPQELIPEKDNYKISKYAYGKDYHSVIKDKLRKLLRKIEETTGPLEARAFTDSAPVLDRAWAERSGLGFIGIGEANLLNRAFRAEWIFRGADFLPEFHQRLIVIAGTFCRNK